jgi:hypothetical protein
LSTRADGALFLDVYRRGGELDSPLVREIAAILHDRTERIRLLPDQKNTRSRISNRAAPGSLLTLGSALRIVYTWLFQSMTDLESRNFKDLGAESIDGRHCVRIEFDAVVGAPPDQAIRSRYWVDLERGGHPLRVEHRREDRLLSRIQIRLANCDADDRPKVWFPIEGWMESFAFNDQYSTSALFKETITIVPSSLRINQNLPDSVFQIDSNGGVTDTTNLARVKDEFLHPPPKPKLRTDLRSVQQRLDDQLAEADKNAARLDASINRERVNWLPWAQAALAIFGFAILTIVGVRRWRGS